MVRLLLGLALCALLLVGVYHTMKSRGAVTAAAPAATPTAVQGPAAASAVVGEYKKIEAANRAALSKTLKAAAER
jgi:hypothetical protein